MLGTVIDQKYQILEVLGAGGAGTVYKAEQRDLGRIVAVKILNENNFGQKVLLREAQTLLKTEHPNIVRVIAVGLFDSKAYMVMEYVPGESLYSCINRSGPLTEERTFNIAKQVCSALEFSHKANIIHRDLKSANIMLTHEMEKNM